DVVERAPGLGEDPLDVVEHDLRLRRDFAAYNEVYARRFGDHRPCRTTVGSTLGGFLVEIDVIAMAGSGG
ncbi:MAG: RidA family protein, partial [Actinomycetota bacterium]